MERPSSATVLESLRQRATGDYQAPGKIEGWGGCIFGTWFVIVRVSRLALDTDGAGDGRVRRWEPTHQPATSYDPSGLVISSVRTPYVVFPGWFAKRFEIPLGTVCAVLDMSQPVRFAMFADYGPARKIGEGSIALHESLGARPITADGRIRDLSIDRPIRIVPLKRARLGGGWSFELAARGATAAEIEALGWQLLDARGMA